MVEVEEIVSKVRGGGGIIGWKGGRLHKYQGVFLNFR